MLLFNQYNRRKGVLFLLKKRIMKKLVIITIIITSLTSTGLFILYGPWDNFRNFWITSAMTTYSHQYLAHLFYSNETIEKVMANNYVIEIDEEPNTSLINKDKNNAKNYTDMYEKQILEKEEGNDLYKVIDIQGSGYRGFLVAVYDPSKIKLVMTKYLNTRGETLTALSEEYSARVGINAGAFGIINDGVPSGSVVQNGKIVFSSNPFQVGGGVIGFDYNNNLILTKDNMQTALNKYNLRDAIEFGPFLIVNGKPSFIKGNGGWGIAPRTVIGQRSDGIVLFLVIDGRRIGYSLGADMVELTRVMTNYKAINAANLDGGLSTTLTVEKVLRNKPSVLSEKERTIPNAWIVTD
jgi:exopolysaccharide biosynthesis protein